MSREVGSEFWLDQGMSTVEQSVSRWLGRYGHVTLTSSGRAAIALMLDEEAITGGTVLLPSYICEAMLQPFTERGMHCAFYDVDENFLTEPSDIVEASDVAVFLHMGYFGFNTNAILEDTIQILKQRGTLIVEDTTHTLFSTHQPSTGNNYIIASLRKWLGLPSGGVLACPRPISPTRKGNHHDFAELRTTALRKKAAYMCKPCPTLKLEFMGLFQRAEHILNKDNTAYEIDSLSQDILTRTDVGVIIRKRRENYSYLFDRLARCGGLRLLGPPLDENTCPFCFPVLATIERNVLQQKLAQQEVYCAAHWPVPSGLPELGLTASKALYDHELSIPCDQRYGLRDMECIADAIESLIDG